MFHEGRVGHKLGSGAPLTAQQLEQKRRERLQALAIETIDIKKDPYFHINHVGKIECKLCLTLHINESSYLTHSQSRKHQTNLKARAAQEIISSSNLLSNSAISKKIDEIKTLRRKMLMPQYEIHKIKDLVNDKIGVRFIVNFIECLDNYEPAVRILNAIEQKIEPVQESIAYVVFSCMPYTNIAFKIPSMRIDRDNNNYITYWDREKKVFYFQFLYSDNINNS